MKDQVDFLSCMDEARTNDALKAAQSCSTGVIDYSTLSACFNGDQGTSLLKTASEIFNNQFPQRATVPHTFVNSKDTTPSYDSLLSVICQSGATAPVCSSVNATVACVV
uniref:Uncharacterized protein n=1 Tax=Lotharella oceanica TaxID=641309 RepID=A0A7S2TJC1_9EUKA|mmetsp:Transcript_16620/g.31507  ORF Transcript_16620/g.31507 Transcript_16620/m.31507 type:complete len:109 (+) Transcript_16620:321-647(+)